MTMIGLKQLCTPAYVYLVISAFALFFMGIQNFGNTDMYCLGSYTCDVKNTSSIFILKVLYIIFWTWLLNVLCKGGAGWFSWFLVLIPFIIMLIALGSVIIMGV